MDKINNQNFNKPIIFIKKKSMSKLINSNNMAKKVGETRHFPPANKEWKNSIYSYDNNIVKLLPISDNNTNKLINGYFNFRKIKIKQNKTTRLSSNKIFVGRPELKHYSNNIVVTLNVCNIEKKILLHKLSSVSKTKVIGLYRKLFLIESLNILNTILAEYVITSIEKYKRKYKHFIELLVNKNYNKVNYSRSLIYNSLKELRELKLYSGLLLSWALNKNYFFKKYIIEDYKSIFNNRHLLELNRQKFEYKSILKLSNILSKLYNKKVEFNVVNLKTLYLNSDIFTKVIALKLKQRKNKLLGVLIRSLYMVKLPNITLNKYEHNMFSLSNSKQNYNLVNEFLNQLFWENFVYEKEVKNNNEKYNSLTGIILNSLKNKRLGGARLEIGGRLTKRFTASRSILKIKWKGSIRNIDSSYKGFSSVMLRGHSRSNVEYSVLNSKIRNGAFGVKGWISSK